MCGYTSSRVDVSEEQIDTPDQATTQLVIASLDRHCTSCSVRFRLLFGGVRVFLPSFLFLHFCTLYSSLHLTPLHSSSSTSSADNTDLDKPQTPHSSTSPLDLPGGLPSYPHSWIMPYSTYTTLLLKANLRDDSHSTSMVTFGGADQSKTSRALCA